MKKRIGLTCCPMFLFFLMYSQSPDILKIRNYREGHEKLIMDEFISFLSIPNIAAEPLNLQKNAEFIMDMMKKRGIGNVQLLNPTTAGAPNVVYGEVKIAGAKNTLIFYAHYDGQPVNPAQWAPGLDPFKPQLADGIIGQGGNMVPFPTDGHYNSDWRVYSRGASDDKAGVFAILNAYEAIVNSNLKPNYNIKFFFEGEEEAGSVHLNEILQKYSGLLASDLWIICDGPVHQSGRKEVVFGVRGDAHLDMTVYASKRPLHSGHYGNWAPNPAMMLAKLLASMKDDKGHVTIKGFYDDVAPLTVSEKNAIKAVPGVDEQMKKELGISATENPAQTLTESLHFPSLNINGMQSGNVGKLASNQIPTTATAVLDLRLVPGNDWQKQQQKVIGHIRTQGYYVTDHEPTDEERAKYGKIIKVIPGMDGYNAQRTSMDLPIAKNVIRAVKSTTTDSIVLLPTMGGSLPLFLIEKFLGAKTITVPIANHDNNQHAENENIRLRNLWNGIETMAALMTMDKEPR